MRIQSGLLTLLLFSMTACTDSDNMPPQPSTVGQATIEIT